VGSVGALGGGDVRVLGGTLSASGANHALVVAGDYLQGPLGILSLRLAGVHSSDDSLEVGGPRPWAGP
jgi:Flp pilus assembly protein protease CpaA